MIEECLLGFDVRELPDGRASLWDDARRNLFLLRPEIMRPLSTDTLVWPSVFDSGQGIGLPASERARLGLAGIPFPAYSGPNAGLWQDRAGMLRYLAEQWQARQAAVVIAISWLSQDGFAEGGPNGPYLDESGAARATGTGAWTPGAAAPGGETTPPGWRLLGLDVADGGFVSGLSNCGYRTEERAALQHAWAAQLNDHHLFLDPEQAFAFRELTDGRVAAHAPFFVYGIYLVEEL